MKITAKVEEEMLASVLAHFDTTEEWINDLFAACIGQAIRAMRLVRREITIKGVINCMTPDALNELVVQLCRGEDSGVEQRTFGATLERYLRRLSDREREMLLAAPKLADRPGRDDADLLDGLLAQFYLEEEWERELYGRHLPRVLQALRLLEEDCTISKVLANVSPSSVLVLAKRIVRRGSNKEEGLELIDYSRSLKPRELRCLEQPEELQVIPL